MNKMINPLRTQLKGEIQDTLELEKKYDKAKAAHESAVKQFKQLTEKAKVNLVKVQEVSLLHIASISTYPLHLSHSLHELDIIPITCHSHH
jgi:hypothetical protein